MQKIAFSENTFSYFKSTKKFNTIMKIKSNCDSFKNSYKE